MATCFHFNCLKHRREKHLDPLPFSGLSWFRALPKTVCDLMLKMLCEQFRVLVD